MTARANALPYQKLEQIQLSCSDIHPSRARKEAVLRALPRYINSQTALFLANAQILPSFLLRRPAGIKRLEQLACWYQKEYPSAAGRLREGLTKLFTINAFRPAADDATLPGLDQPDQLVTLGDSQKTPRVTHRRDGQMALRWAASAMEATALHFLKVT